MSCIKPNSVFGANKYIKFTNNKLCAIEGPVTHECIDISGLRVPYAQVLKARIILKPGQQDYLLNHLGLGDNANLVTIIPNYNTKSRDEEINYISYKYADDVSKEYYLSQMLILTGNSVKRVRQLYLSNPNTEFSVSLDVMVAIIDDQDSFFTTVDNNENYDIVLPQTGCILYTNIITWVQGETIAITNTMGDPISFIQIQDINSLQRLDDVVIIDDSSVGTIALKFCDEFNSLQGLSILNWVLENPTLIIQDDYNAPDTHEPVIEFTQEVSIVGSTAMGGTNSCGGTFSLAATDFESTSLVLTDYGGVITKQDLIDHIICEVSDNIDGIISLTYSQMIVKDLADNVFTAIINPAIYVITFDLSDIANNVLNPDINVIIEITS